MTSLKFIKYSKRLFFNKTTVFKNLKEEISVESTFLSFVFVLILGSIFPGYILFQFGENSLIKYFALGFGAYFLYLLLNSIVLFGVMRIFGGKGSLTETIKFVLSINLVSAFCLAFIPRLCYYSF